MSAAPPSSPPRPEQGDSRDSIFAALEAFRREDLQWRSGRVFGYVYDPGREAEEVGKAAYALYLTENGLDPTSFPSLLRLENEILAMARARLHGDERTVGSFTSGGTESIILAVKAAREWGRQRGIADPEMVIPLTAHAAFHKAAHYLGVKVVTSAVDPTTYRADPGAMAPLITERTVLLVASAPSYAHGVIDPVAEIAALAAARGILCHVDACVGGWLLPAFRQLGSPIPDFDFRVPGVTSINMDLHKYAFTPKGASVVLYRDAELRRHQIYACASWTGYSVVNMAVQSSKSGGPLAAAWAVMHHLGEAGYLEIARRMRDSTAALVDGIRRIPGLRVLSEPEMCLLAFAGDGVDVFHIVDEMKMRGWYVQAQFGRGPSPANVHLSVGPNNAPWVEAFLADLAASVEAARAMPVSELAAQVGATFAALDPAAVSDETIRQMMSLAGATSGGLPGRFAEINQILDRLPPPLVERALVEFLGTIFRG